MLNIVVIAQRVPYPPNKGEKLRTFHQIVQMVDEGHKVTVLSPIESDEEAKNAQALASHLSISVETFSLPSKPLRYIRALLTNRSMSELAFFSSPLQRALIELLKLQQVHVLYCSASCLAPYLLALPSEVRQTVKLAVDFMDVDSDKWRQYANTSEFPMSWVYQREAKLIRKLEANCANSFDACYLIADAEVALFRQHVSASGKVKTLGNGMDFSAFYPGETSPNKPPCFLFTGVMDYKPNIDAVMWFAQKCWPTLKAQYPDAEFVIAGMNPSQEVQQLAEHAGVVVTGFVEDILPYYHGATTFVAPFRLARGVQNKVLQAFACALPVVTTSMGAEGITFIDRQCCYIADDSDSFVAACKQTINEPDAANAKGQLALKLLLKTYSWPHQLAPLTDDLSKWEEQ